MITRGRFYDIERSRETLNSILIVWPDQWWNLWFYVHETGTPNIIPPTRAADIENTKNSYVSYNVQRKLFYVKININGWNMTRYWI